MQNTQCVHVHQLTKVYGKGVHKKTVCSKIDFCASEGSITGVLGANGAGKSTLLKTIAALQYPTTGSICVCNKTDFTEIRNISAFVPEIPLLHKNVTVLELLEMEAALYAHSLQEKNTALQYAIKSTELESVLSKKVAHLSKGFLQRTSLAKALVSNPRVLILDEFSSGLDPAHIVGIRKLLLELAKKRVIILSTHNIQEAELLCKHIYILHKGFVVAEGSAPEIVQKTKTAHLEEAFLKLTACEIPNKSEG